MSTKSKKGRSWTRVLPRLSKTETTQAVEHLAQLLGVPQSIFSGPLTKGSLPLDDISAYRMDRLSQDFLAKYPGFTWGNPRKTAEEAFRKSEQECRSTNDRLRHEFLDGSMDNQEVVQLTRKKIRDVLGRFDWRSVLERGRFGPGVTSSLHGTRLHDSNKFGAMPEVSPSFAKTGMSLLGSLPSWSALLCNVDYGTWVNPLASVVPGNRVTFVPKNAKTDRSIAVEPTLNIFFQLGVGTLIRERLKAQGLDLGTQENNQALARLGSVDDSLSTIDLERASDTLSRRLVEYLLPDDWFAALNRLRSQFGWGPFVEGRSYEWTPYEKFSSMGNGFTFELESLIFWSLCASVASVHGYNPFWCTSYGDDIVVPSGIYDETVRWLNWAGFTVNLEKSYHTGPFRESCGRDYLRGGLVRPVYLKEIPDNPLSWIKIANNVKRLAHTWADFEGLDGRLAPAYQFAVSMIPREFRRLGVSDGYGDVALIRDFDAVAPKKAESVSESYSGWEGYVTNVILSRSITYESKDRSLVTAGVHTPGRLGNRLPYRNAVEWTIGPMYIAQWRNMGAWS